MLNTISGEFIAYMHVKESNSNLIMFSDCIDELKVSWANKVTIFKADGLTGKDIEKLREGQPVGRKILEKLYEDKTYVWGAQLDVVEPPRLDSLKNIIQAIKDKSIDYGENRQYFLVLDEDGELVLIKRSDDKRDRDVPMDESIDFDNLDWPTGRYDGETVWKMRTGENRGTTITEQFLEILKIQIM